MIYSCFDAPSGMYDYFESDEELAINADMPVPDMAPIAGQIGIPAQDLGRPLPPGAERIGRGWRAMGAIGRCGNKGARGGLGALSFGGMSGGTVLLLAGLAILAGMMLQGQKHSARGYSR